VANQISGERTENSRLNPLNQVLTGPKGRIFCPDHWVQGSALPPTAQVI
jgi:hypothetical protein